MSGHRDKRHSRLVIINPDSFFFNITIYRVSRGKHLKNIVEYNKDYTVSEDI